MTDDKNKEKALPKSNFTLGGTRLDKLTHAELLEAVETVWRSKNEQIDKLTAERDAYIGILKTPLPIHSLWRGCCENAMLMLAIGVVAYLAGAK